MSYPVDASENFCSYYTLRTRALHRRSPLGLEPRKPDPEGGTGVRSWNYTVLVEQCSEDARPKTRGRMPGGLRNKFQVRMRLTVSAHLAIYTEKQTFPNPDKSTSAVTTGNEAESLLVAE